MIILWYNSTEREEEYFYFLTHNTSFQSFNLYINCCLALKFQSSASDTYHCHIIATKYPAWCPGQSRALGCQQGPAGNLSLSPSRPPPLSGSLPSSGMCDSFPALLPQTTTQLENSAALIHDGTAVVCLFPEVVCDRGSLGQLHCEASFSSECWCRLFVCCYLAQSTDAGTSLTPTVELRV